MADQTKSTDEFLIAVNALAMWFYNYTNDDINVLRGRSRDFDHVWDTYIQGSKKNTFDLLWEMWQSKFNNATKSMLIEFALEKYGDHQRKSLEMSKTVAAVFARLTDKPGRQ